MPPNFAGPCHRARHRARAGVEQSHPAVVLDQVHVAASGLALHDPYAFGHQLRLAAGQPRRQAGLGVERTRQTLVRCRALGGHHPELAGERDRVGICVVGVDQTVAHGQQVEALDHHRIACGRDPAQ